MDLFLHVFHMFFSYYRIFDIGMFALRSSVSVQVIKKIFRIINKLGVQIRSVDRAGKKFKNQQAGRRLFGTQEYLPAKFVNFLKSRLIFNIFYCF